jgi:hypothetical protein
VTANNPAANRAARKPPRRTERKVQDHMGSPAEPMSRFLPNRVTRRNLGLEKVCQLS